MQAGWVHAVHFRQRAALEAEERLVAERLRAEERAREEIREQGLRELQLAHTARVMHECEIAVRKADAQRKQELQVRPLNPRVFNKKHIRFCFRPAIINIRLQNYGMLNLFS